METINQLVDKIILSEAQKVFRLVLQRGGDYESQEFLKLPQFSYYKKNENSDVYCVDVRFPASSVGLNTPCSILIDATTEGNAKGCAYYHARKQAEAVADILGVNLLDGTGLAKKEDYMYSPNR